MSEYGVQPVGYDELLQRSDIVSMHAPGTKDAHHLMKEQHFRKMKKTALFVNTGRGSTVDEAAMIDGATRFQTFRKIVLPMVKGGIAASAVLVFIFCWTEFLLSLFLTTEIRTVPVKIQTFVTSTGNEWGFIAALGTAAMIPGFIFILLVQKNLVRGLTLGSLKE